ncbi:hypothetical protein HHK36_022592 [Tetracentron sinense]|uniref:Uncharacterized protein n=1 Tax=Tetracentron sinense TaxID=13715 RepID=A0A834YS85_TETSI|nr:hypothetical protein HHK36_032269 [Tetracentron sinense]KAF8392250.1 hypothetical protein HHK36_022592 [Tetracentron sinense]
MAFECAGKDSWPELLGTQGHVAAATIERENPLVTAEIVLEGTIVPINIVPVCTRVRVWVDNSGTVTRVPTIG